MIRSTFGIVNEPFHHHKPALMPHQVDIFEYIKIHGLQGGFCVVVGDAGVGKSVLRQQIEQLNEDPSVAVISLSRTLHTYLNILQQIAESFNIEASTRHLEKMLIKTAFECADNRKTLYIVIDEAHLLDMEVLRKLRLLFEQFPRQRNLVLMGETGLMQRLSMLHYQDIKSRITYSAVIPKLCDDDLIDYIRQELNRVKLGANTFDEGALNVIARNAEGNLRLCRNLAYSSLLEACRAGQKIVTITHVNVVLVQPHWRSHEELIQQQVPSKSK